MAGVAAVGVHNNPSSGEAGVAHGTADNKASGWIDVRTLYPLSEAPPGNHGLDDRLDHGSRSAFDGNVGRMLVVETTMAGQPETLPFCRIPP